MYMAYFIPANQHGCMPNELEVGIELMHLQNDESGYADDGLDYYEHTDPGTMLSKRKQRDDELDRRIEALRRKNQALVKRYQEVEDDKKKAAEEDEGQGEEVETVRSGRGQTEDLTITINKSSREKRTVVTKPGSGDFGARGDGPKLGAGRGSRRQLLVTMAGNNNNKHGKRVVSETPQKPCPASKERSILIGNGGQQRVESGGRKKLPAPLITKDEVRQFQRQTEDHHWLSEYELHYKDSEQQPGHQPFHPQEPGPSSPTAAHLTPISSEEHQEYLRWKRERDAIDRERVARHKNSQGQWRRAWDVDKTENMFPKRDHDAPVKGGKAARRGQHRSITDPHAHQPERRAREKGERGVTTAPIPGNDQVIKTAPMPGSNQGVKTASTTSFDQGGKTASTTSFEQGGQTASTASFEQGGQTASTPGSDQGVMAASTVRGGRGGKKAPVTSGSKAQGRDRLTGRARRWDAAEAGDSPETSEPSLEAFLEELDALTNTMAHPQQSQPSPEPSASGLSPDKVPVAGAAEDVEVQSATPEGKSQGSSPRGTEKKVWFSEELVQVGPVHNVPRSPPHSLSQQKGSSPGPTHYGTEEILSLEDQEGKLVPESQQRSSLTGQNLHPHTDGVPGSSSSDDRGIHPGPSLSPLPEKIACPESENTQDDSLLHHRKSEPDSPPPPVGLPEPTAVEVEPAEPVQSTNSSTSTTDAHSTPEAGHPTPAHSSSPGQV